MSSSVRTNSKSSLFLIELIVTLCFFSLASVVCVRLFVYAHKVSTESRRETLAIQISQNAAECFIAADGDPEEFRRLFNMTLPQDREDIITDFTITRADGDAPADTIRNTAVDGTEIFSLEVLHYRQKGSAGESEAANEQ